MILFFIGSIPVVSRSRETNIFVCGVIVFYVSLELLFGDSVACGGRGDLWWSWWCLFFVGLSYINV
jgi:hypothetical protein